MKRFRISVLLLLTASLASMAWAQQPFGGNQHGRLGRSLLNAMQHADITAPRTLTAQGTVATNIRFWDLGTLGGSGSWASDVNDFGIVAGWSNAPETDFQHPAMVRLFGPKAMQWVDLGTFGGEGFAQVEGVSDTGLLVGEATTDTGNVHGFVWTFMTGKVDLGTLPGHTDSQAWDVNRIGTLIVGYSVDPDGNWFPVVWTPSVKWTQHGFVTTWTIHLLDASALGDFPYGQTVAVNNLGQILGEAWGDSGYVTVLWSPAGKSWTAKQLPGSTDYPNSWPAELNDLGQAVGTYCDADWVQCGGALWQTKGTKRVYKFIPLANPWGLLNGDYGVGINNRGDIVGVVYGDRSYAAHWTTKNPASVQLLPPADAAWSYAANVNEWGTAAGGFGGADFGIHAIAWQLH